MNLLNVSSYSESALNTDITWVHAIRTLPPANVKAILNVLNWSRYVGENGEFNANMLLDELNIQYQSSDQEFMQLENLLWLMKKQSETCLQGVSLIVFKALKAGLEAQQAEQFYLREKLQNRKPKALLKSNYRSK